MLGSIGVNAKDGPLAPSAAGPAPGRTRAGLATQPVLSTIAAANPPFSTARRLTARATTASNGSFSLRFGGGRKHAEPHFHTQVAYRPVCARPNTGSTRRSMPAPPYPVIDPYRPVIGTSLRIRITAGPQVAEG
jgi:hypothetical protein